MDFGRIKARGTSTTGKAWATNPLRSVLWRLTLPYFQGFAEEIDQRRRAELTAVWAKIDQLRRAELTTLREEIDQLRRTELTSLREEIDQLRRTELTTLREETMLAVASHLAGARKDFVAMAHRLAGLEEEAAAAEQARTMLTDKIAAAAAEAHGAAAYASSLQADVRSSVQALGERIAAAAAEAHEAAAYASSLQADVRSSVQALGERIAAAAAEAHEAAAYASSLQADVRSSVQALGERIAAAATEAHEAAAYASSLQADVRSSVQALGERITAAATEAHGAAAYASSLHQDVRSSAQALNDRIDFLARGAPMRAGDRVSVGQDDLTLVATASGQHFLVRQHDLIGHLIADGREWEPHVRTAIERAARPDAVAVDVGAYIGLHTVTMSRWFRTVHAFEPQRGIYQLLCGNLALNGCTNVAAHNSALYDRAGPMRLAPPERQEVPIPLRNGQPDYARIANAAALTFEVVDAGSGEVQAAALDDLALEEVALMKVDTQGADLRVLRGAEGTIRRCRPSILFEWERDLGAQHGAKLEDYYDFFAALDYDVDVLQETSPGRQADYLAKPR